MLSSVKKWFASSEQEESHVEAPFTEEGTSIPFIHCNDDGKFEISQDAQNMLRSIDGPLGVVAVCGRARQGKSYILNRLSKEAGGSHGGFKVGSTHEPCTKGLWIWNKPLLQTAADGTPYHLLLLDTEGVDAYDQTAQYSTQIFALAMLLSSTFIYNQFGGIDEAAIERLALVTEISKTIRSKSSPGQSFDAWDEFSPNFIWLLRDFFLDLSDDTGQSITPEEYLETALREIPGDKNFDKNQSRASIKTLFPKRQCIELVRPVTNEKDLQNLDRLPREKIRPEFTSGVEKLMRITLQSTAPKRWRHSGHWGSVSTLTGPACVGLAESYVKSINDGVVPVISSAWNMLADTQCQNAVQYAADVYKRRFGAPTTCSEEELMAEHQESVRCALEEFAKMAMGSTDLQLQFKEKLQAQLEEEFQKHKTTILQQSTSANSRLLHGADTRLGKAGAAAQLMAVINEEIKRYRAEASGPEKGAQLADFLQRVLEVRVGPRFVSQDKLLTEKKVEVESLRKEVERLAASEQAAEQRCRRLQEQLNSLDATYQMARHEQTATAKEKEELTQRQRKVELERARLKDQTRQLEEDKKQTERTLERTQRQEAEAKEKARVAEEERAKAEILAKQEHEKNERYAEQQQLFNQFNQMAEKLYNLPKPMTEVIGDMINVSIPAASAAPMENTDDAAMEESTPPTAANKRKRERTPPPSLAGASAALTPPSQSGSKTPASGSAGGSTGKAPKTELPKLEVIKNKLMTSQIWKKGMTAAEMRGLYKEKFM